MIYRGLNFQNSVNVGGTLILEHIAEINALTESIREFLLIFGRHCVKYFCPNGFCRSHGISCGILVVLRYIPFAVIEVLINSAVSEKFSHVDLHGKIRDIIF